MSNAEMPSQSVSSAAERQRRSRIFISYNRVDRDIVDWIHAELCQRGYDAFLDVYDIAATEEWRARLEQLILSADGVVFVVTDSALQSPICGWEVARALTHGKRVFPFVHGPRTTAVPSDLAKFNFIFTDDPCGGTSRPAHPSATAMDLLSAAIDVDIVWVREHSRLVARANEWSFAPPMLRRARLLKQEEVAAARGWLALKPEKNAPAVPAVLLDWLQASEEHERALSEERRRIIGRAFVKPAQAAFVAGDYSRALRLNAAGTILGEDLGMSLVPERETEGALRRSAFLDPRRSVTRADAPAVDVAFSPDGRLAAGSWEDGQIKLIDVASGRTLRSLEGHTLMVRRLCFDPSSTRLASASFDGSAVVWDIESGQRIHTLTHDDKVRCVSFSPDGGILATGGDDTMVRLWSTTTGEELRRMSAHTRAIHAVRSSTDGTKWLTVSADETGHLWSAWGYSLAVLEGHESAIYDGAFSHDGRRVVTSSMDDTARIWDAETGSALRVLRGHANLVKQCRFSPDDRLVATASWDSTARIWDSATGKQLHCLEGHVGELESIVFDLAGRRALTAGHDGTARVWTVEDGNQILCLNGSDGCLGTAAFASDGRRIATAANDGAVCIWDSAAHTLISTLRGHRSETMCSAFSCSSKYLATSALDRTLCVWDLATGDVAASYPTSNFLTKAKFIAGDMLIVGLLGYDNIRVWDWRKAQEVQSFGSDGQSIESFDLDADRAMIVGGCSDGVARVWSMESGKLLRSFASGARALHSVAISPDRAILATGDDCGTTYLWNWLSGDLVARFPDGKGHVISLAFSADGRFLTSVSDYGPVNIFDVPRRSRHAIWDRHSDSIRGIQCHPSAPCAVTVSHDRTAIVWDIETGAEIAVLVGHDDYVTHATINSDGKLLATCSKDGTVRLWDVSRVATLTGHPGVVLAAALSAGRGPRSRADRDDLLMRSAPDDLFIELMAGLDDHSRKEVLRRSDVLASPIHPKCYEGRLDSETAFLTPAEKAARYLR